MPGNDLKEQWFINAIPLPTTANFFLGVTVVIAPHPDDESLGCGGTIALLKQAGKKVHIIFVSDGSMSHPNSKKYAAPRLMELREKEAITAVDILGVPITDCSFIRLKDGAVPGLGSIGFEEAVYKMSRLLETIHPGNIILPWKNDPHPDHQASWQIVQEAILKTKIKVNLFHYLIWFWERGILNDQLKDILIYSMDINTVINLKRAAIEAHVSQVTSLIDDDETGFMLSEKVLAHFNDPFELFIQLKN